MSVPTFNAQVSSCESALSFDGSEFNSTSNSEAMLLDHEYADPVELKKSIKLEMDRIDRKKKQNLIYEPTTVTQLPKKEGARQAKARCNLRNWCVVFVFIISSCALALSLLVTLGIVTTKSLEEEDNGASRSPPQSQKLASTTAEEQEKTIKELQEKVELIPDLLDELESLKTKLANLTLEKGSKGDRGPPGPEGPAGPGSLSKCKYRTEAGTVSFHNDDPQKTVGTTAKVISDDKTTIIGASCSTVGGAEFGLQQKVQQGKRFFWCKCAGKSAIEAFSNFDLECYLHYWACPITS